MIEGDFQAPNWLDLQRLHHNPRAGCMLVSPPTLRLGRARAPHGRRMLQSRGARAAPAAGTTIRSCLVTSEGDDTVERIGGIVAAGVEGLDIPRWTSWGYNRVAVRGRASLFWRRFGEDPARSVPSTAGL